MATDYKIDGVSLDDAGGWWQVGAEIYQPTETVSVSRGGGDVRVPTTPFVLFQTYTVRDVVAFRDWLDSIPWGATLSRPRGGQTRLESPVAVEHVGDPFQVGAGAYNVHVEWRGLTGVWREANPRQIVLRSLPAWDAQAVFPVDGVRLSVLNPLARVKVTCGMSGSWIMWEGAVNGSSPHLLIDTSTLRARRGREWFPHAGDDVSDGLTVCPDGFTLCPGKDGKFSLTIDGAQPTDNPHKVEMRAAY